MSSHRLVGWVALVAGAAGAAGGQLAANAFVCVAGALLVAGAVVALTRETRARRVGAAVAVAWTALVAADAALSAWARGRIAAAPDRSGVVAPDWRSAPRSLALAPPPDGAFVLLALGGASTAPVGEHVPAWPTLLERELAVRFACARPLAVLDAGRADDPLGGGAAAVDALPEGVRPDLVLALADAGLLELLLEEEPALRFATPPVVGPRASALGAAIERSVRAARIAGRWRDALARPVAVDPHTSDVGARYRALIDRAKRAGADTWIAIPPLAVSGDSPADLLARYERTRPETRSLVLAARAHAAILDAVARTYGAGTIDLRPGLEGAGPRAFVDLDVPSVRGHEHIARTMSLALAERLGQPVPGCAFGPRAHPASR